VENRVIRPRYSPAEGALLEAYRAAGKKGDWLRNSARQP
jgi:hypothetical protein